MRARNVYACLLGISLFACSAIPDVEYSYYVSKMNGVATAVQSVTCTPPPDQRIIITNTASFAPTYSADRNRGPFNVRIRAIEGAFSAFADSDANFSFFDDGRLRTINQSTTGQGEAIIKSVVSLSSTFAGILAAKVPKEAPPKPPPPCDVVQTWGDKSKTGAPVIVSLNYSAQLNIPSTVPLSHHIGLMVTDASKPLQDAFTNAGLTLPKFTLLIGQPSDGNRATNISAQNNGFGGEFVNLALQTVATVEMKIVADQQNTTDGTKVIWKGDVPIPTSEMYNLPIPRAALFGAQKFALTLSEAGAITAVEYGKNTGAAGAANAAGSIATALSPETVAAKAADLKAQADLIAQQQRLHRCQLNPTTCQ